MISLVAMVTAPGVVTVALAGQLSLKKSSSTGLYNLIIAFSYPPDNQPARLSPTAQQHPRLAGRRLPGSKPADP